MDLTFCKSERRKARTALRNYMVLFRDEIVNDYKINLPTQKEIRQMHSGDFDVWFNMISDDLKNKEIDIVLNELIDNYICCVNNVATAEYEETLMMP